jgi:hypothetical protein
MLTPKELILRPKPAPLSDFNLAQSPSRIIACPNPPIEALQAGHAIAIPNESFSVQDILKQLPFQPDFVSLSARVMTFLPHGLHKLNCPTVMKLGDTFHLGDGGLSRMVKYCQSLNCDYHWTYQSPQHLHFFAESGLKNVFWLPASTVIDPYIPKPSKKEYNVIFRGSESELHQYRTHILRQIQTSGIEIDICQKDYVSALEDYTKANIVINSSLNGDLNRRVFEVLMAGGFLLSDRIRPQSGLFELFEEGTHFECYGNEAELIQKIQFYLAHPQKASQIAAAGHQHFLTYYSQQAIQQKLYEAIFKQIESPKHDRRLQTAQNLPTRLKLYELIQELHRIYPMLKILCWQTGSTIVSDLADLSRAQLTHVVEPERLSQIQASYLQSGIQAQVNVQTTTVEEFQIVVIDGTHRFLRRRIQESISYLGDRGFFIIIQPFNLLAIQQINQWLSKHYCIPVQLSISLFNQKYDLSLEQHGLIYQKITPEAYSTPTLDPSKLRLTQTNTRKMIQTQLKNLPILDRILQLLRYLRHTPA